MAQLTQKQITTFLSFLAETAHVSKSAKAAGASRQAFYQLRQRDSTFAQSWGEALSMGADLLEEEAIRRARDGWEQPVFYKGVAVGTVRKFSDVLLIFLLKGAKPEKYRERQEVINKSAVDEPPIRVKSEEDRRKLIKKLKLEMIDGGKLGPKT